MGYELWPPDSYPTLDPVEPTVTGCTLDDWTAGLSELTADSPAVAAVTTRLIRPIFVKGQGGVLRWSVAVANATGNLLSDNQASVESSTTGFAAGSNCSGIVASADYAAHGSQSLKATATAAGTMIVATSVYPPVTVGRTYTGSVSYRLGAGVGTVGLHIAWRDAGGVELSATSYEYGPVPSTSWQTVQTTGVAPANAATGRIRVAFASTAASDFVYLDEWGLWAGSGGSWSMPGSLIPGVTGGSEMDAYVQVQFLDGDGAQVDRWTGPQRAFAESVVLSSRVAVPRRATQAQLKVLTLHDTHSGQWTEIDSRLEQIPAEDPYVPPPVDVSFGDVSPEGVAPPAPPAGLPGFEANSPARRSPQVRWCQLHDSVRPDLTPKKNAREV